MMADLLNGCDDTFVLEGDVEIECFVVESALGSSLCIMADHI